MNPEVSVVIPTIEEESVFRLIKGLRKLLGNGAEIIIVDKSPGEYHERLKKTGATVLRQRDRGVENAIMLGLRHSRGRILVSIDADGTHDIKGIPKAIGIIKRREADLVLGNRFGNLEEGSMSFYLWFGNTVLSWLFSTKYRTRIRDVLTGLFVISRRGFDSIRNVKPYRAGIAFFAIEMVRKGYRIREIGISYYKRKYGSSKLTKSKFAYGFTVASHILKGKR